jgi:hypothetical protein
MKKAIILFTVLSLISCVSSGDFPAVKGWKSASQVKTYEPSTLWEYINGAAELFLAFDFQELKVMDLKQKDRIVTANIYDMGTPLNAFGMYMTERASDEEVLKIGGEGYVSAPYQCMVYKDKYYVKVDAYEGEITHDVGKALLTAIAAALPGNDGPPEALNKLPSGNRVKGSERFMRQAYLGLSELTSCIIADFDIGSADPIQGFYMLLPEGSSHAEVKKRLSEKWNSLQDGDREIIYRSVPYRGLVGMIPTDTGFLGVAGAENEEMLKDWLRRIAE